MKVLVLIGGKGTRMSPMTDFCPKEMFPMVTEPFLQLLVKQIMGAGIKDEDIIFVTSEDKRPITTYFHDRGINVKFFEDSGTGLGNAIIDGVDYAVEEGEPFMVVLGDMMVYNKGNNLLSYMVDLHENTTFNVLGAIYETENFFKYCSIIREGLNVTELVEKPAKLVSDLSCSGHYIFNYEFYDLLKKYKQNGDAYGFTYAMNDLLKKQSFTYAVNREGKLLDVGTPDAYIEAVNIIGKEKGFIK